MTCCVEYHPNVKGKIERFQETVGSRLAARGVPGHTSGPRHLDGTPKGSQSSYLKYEDLPAVLDIVLNEYHTAHHEGINETPLNKWLADPTPVDVVDQPLEEFRALMMATEIRRVVKDGIRKWRTSYNHPLLATSQGDQVEIRFLPHDHRSILVFRNGEFLCEAVPSETMPQEQKEEFVRVRRERVKHFKRQLRAAHAAAKAIRQPLTNKSESPDIVALPTNLMPVTGPAPHHFVGHSPKRQRSTVASAKSPRSRLDSIAFPGISDQPEKVDG